MISLICPSPCSSREVQDRRGVGASLPGPDTNHATAGRPPGRLLAPCCTQSQLETPRAWEEHGFEVDIFPMLVWSLRGADRGLGWVGEWNRKGRDWHSLGLLKQSSSPGKAHLPSTREKQQGALEMLFSSKPHLINAGNRGAWITQSPFCSGKSQDSVTRGYLWENTEIYGVCVRRCVSWVIVCLSLTSEQEFQKRTCHERGNRKRPVCDKCHPISTTVYYPVLRSL